jgi:hypothetical protein
MAGTTASLNLTNQEIDTSWDGIVIIDEVEGLPGGKTLDVTGFAPEYILAGHIIIEETATGALKPLPISGTAYGALPASHTYKGINKVTILKTQPFAAVMVRGSVNQVAFVNSGGYTGVPAGAVTALPLIRFTKD